MTFLLPLGLLALLTLPVILLLHLLRERRRRVAVPSLLHWQNLPRKREGERIRRLPLTLLLLLHLLVAALIGLALGWPQLAGALGGTRAANCDHYRYIHQHGRARWREHALCPGA